MEMADSSAWSRIENLFTSCHSLLRRHDLSWLTKKNIRLQSTMCCRKSDPSHYGKSWRWISTSCTMNFTRASKVSWRTPPSYLKLLKSQTTACKRAPPSHSIPERVVADVTMKQIRSRFLPIDRREMTKVYSSAFSTLTKQRGTKNFSRTIQSVLTMKRRLYSRCMQLKRQDTSSTTRRSRKNKILSSIRRCLISSTTVSMKEPSPPLTAWRKSHSSVASPKTSTNSSSRSFDRSPEGLSYGTFGCSLG